MRDGCPFCDYEGPNRVLSRSSISPVGGQPVPMYVIEPLEPVTPGHLLVIPEWHCPDFRDDPMLLGYVMRYAAQIARMAAPADAPSCNLIISAGTFATQTVGHMHVHVVPRRAGDGLALPWDGGEVAAAAAALLDEVPDGFDTSATHQDKIDAVWARLRKALGRGEEA